MRGVAITGVLLAYTVWNLGAPPRDTWSAADHAIAQGMDLFVDGKFLTMFACLFGVGVAQQWLRWTAAGHDPLPHHLRRMGFLLGVGLLHATLLRNGDILAPYALLGFTLLLFRRARDGSLVVAAVVLVVLPYALRAAWQVAGWPWPARPTSVEGGYLAQNLAWLRYWYSTLPLTSWPLFLALMLAGLLIGRHRVIERLAADRARAARVLVVAFGLAIITRLGIFRLEAMQPTARAWQLAGSALYEFSAWSLAATYAGALLLAMRSARVTELLRPVRAMGRMAFTNYLLQAVLVVPLCLAFGLFDTVTPTRGLLLGFASATLQLAFSTWWVGRFGMGPLERVWRGVTYGGKG